MFSISASPVFVENFRRRRLKLCISTSKGRKTLKRKCEGTFQFALFLPAGQVPKERIRGEHSTGLVNAEVLSAPLHIPQPLFAARLGGQQRLQLQEQYLLASKGMKPGRAHLFCILTIILSFPRTTKALKIPKPSKIKLSTFRLRISEKLGSHSSKHF